MPNGLIAVGPTDPVHGFPLWYEDSDGTRLELGLDPNDANLPALELPTPGAPVVFPNGGPGNFPDEAFYFIAEAEMLVGGPAGSARARLILALEAAFGGTGAVVDGQQMVFGRIRLRIDDVEPGATYTATGPYGAISGEADDRGRVFETEDIGATGDFTSPFASRIGPFLRWAANPPTGYLGDGVSERTVTIGTGATPGLLPAGGAGRRHRSGGLGPGRPREPQPGPDGAVHRAGQGGHALRRDAGARRVHPGGGRRGRRRLRDVRARQDPRGHRIRNRGDGAPGRRRPLRRARVRRRPTGPDHRREQD